MIEVNLDGLVGPTHHYGGLGVGNRASLEHAKQASFPREGALQGLAKMWKLASLGVPQGVLPPCLRPNPVMLYQQGFQGKWEQVVQDAFKNAPEILSAAYSSAFMWAANAATVSPGVDSKDGRLHLTVANLVSSLHRSQEAEERHWMLKQCFEQDDSVVVHSHLISCYPLRDEGAANQMRLWGQKDAPGIQIFVHGDHLDPTSVGSSHFLARQGKGASQAIARLHLLDSESCFFLEQSDLAIQAGAFHNDVVATSHEDLLIYHQDAFHRAEFSLDQIERRFSQICGRPLRRIEVSRDSLSLQEAIACYLFNSQIVTLPQADPCSIKRMLILAPKQCELLPSAKRIIESWISDVENPIAQVNYVELDQSMANGGGPACLRLRIQMMEAQRLRSKPALWLDESLRDWLEDWIVRRYPERLTQEDLGDPSLGRDAWATIRELYEKLEWRAPLHSTQSNPPSL